MTVVPVAERMTAAKFLERPDPERGRPWNLVLPSAARLRSGGRVAVHALGAAHSCGRARPSAVVALPRSQTH